MLLVLVSVINAGRYNKHLQNLSGFSTINVLFFAYDTVHLCIWWMPSMWWLGNPGSFHLFGSAIPKDCEKQITNGLARWTPVMTRMMDPSIPRREHGKSCPLARNVCLDCYILASIYYSSQTLRLKAPRAEHSIGLGDLLKTSASTWVCLQLLCWNSPFREARTYRERSETVKSYRPKFYRCLHVLLAMKSWASHLPSWSFFIKREDD